MSKPTSLIAQYLADVHELDQYLSGKPVTLTGSDLSLPQIAAIALYPPATSHTPTSHLHPHAPPLHLSDSECLRSNHAASRHVISSKVDAGLSIYGVSTGFGGSADTRTDDPISLGVVVPSSASRTGSVPSGPMHLTDPTHSTTMPPPWTRAALLVRTNSLLRGHSGVRWELVEKMVEVIRKGLVPLVPLRGSISASGDLSSLSYIAGMLIGNPAIRVWMLSPPCSYILTQSALALTHTTPLPLASKEHLGILNGTAFSAGLAALVVNSASEVLTALSIEAMIGSRGAFDPFIGQARPHAGQIESAHLIWSLLSGSKFAEDEEVDVKLEDDEGVLRQDRYSLRTAPQWLGPQFEDIKRVRETVRIEVNSTTDNPLVEPPSKIHHAGNFQALSLTNAMDHLRLSLSHIGRLMFVQLTEIINPAMNRGLPGNLAGGEGALDFGCKGLDIAGASSLALISARYTLSALEVSQLLAATHLFVVCQALDCRAIYFEMRDLSTQVVKEVLQEVFNFAEGDEVVAKITRKIMPHIQDVLDRTTGMDTAPRMSRVAGEAVAPLLQSITSIVSSSSSAMAFDLSAFDLGKISTFRTALAHRLEVLLTELKCAYLGVDLGDVRGGSTASNVSASSFGSSTSPAPSKPTLLSITARGPAPASPFLAPRTRILYEFVRKSLGIGMHGADNLRGSVFGMRSSSSVGDDDLPGLSGVDEDTIAGLGEKVDTTVGDKVSIIVEAIRDGRIGKVLARVCEGVDV
ncbi:phenylalanine ammonia-lyase [Melanogaster broomeanus]|nr:phenylalanine ammonia-lyase [Melanogaster broomeanus]